jgi:DNA-binding NtrC family response regulator
MMSGKPIVLVVEDEPLLRLLAMDVVEDAGFEAVYAANADAAVAILETRTDIRIVFTDVDMPGSMDGIKLAAAVRGRWPPIEIIVVSGHLHVDLADLPDGSRFFSKPYNSESVIEALREMAA